MEIYGHWNNDELNVNMPNIVRSPDFREMILRELDWIEFR